MQNPYQKNKLSTSHEYESTHQQSCFLAEGVLIGIDNSKINSTNNLPLPKTPSSNTEGRKNMQDQTDFISD